MEVGDLVRPKKYCKSAGRWAAVIAVPDALKCVKIIFYDTGETVSALINNLEVINENSSF